MITSDLKSRRFVAGGRGGMTHQQAVHWLPGLRASVQASGWAMEINWIMLMVEIGGDSEEGWIG